MLKRAKEAEKTSYGIVVNGFYVLKSVYADYYRNVLGMKAWHIGAVSLCNRNNEEKTLRKSNYQQVLILDHEAVGGFVTHCGWNSMLEGIAAGLPMVKWPVLGEQLYNEKLVTQVLKNGVGVGAQKWVIVVGDTVRKEAVEKAVRRIMVGEEAQEMRSRARELAEQANRAV
ncbi:scopoletin glucosyltransferase-like [Pyrus ussuriensis x Pyrus communis]|uniref:Scopoletin glucosyltransferase-like n=1 Tax=Pyrus ussuriensis x Pyrus communis TaxID=2448454 RepID=A0A5N5ILC5_9ROSA|nr:scopoletin glucosyltransferase-like [Pyrus ussuriensis x Pyrus communis]